jgi:hypothetical protein
MRPLRIFLCCQQDLKEHRIPAYRFWAASFRAAFAECGHSCLEAPGCDWAEGLSPRETDAHQSWRETTWQRALDWIRREHSRRPIDLFLSYLYPEQIETEGLAQLRSMGIPSVNFFCDNVRLFRKVPREFQGFDLHWVPETGGAALYRASGLSFLQAPMACWVDPKWRTVPLVESLRPTFVGTRDELRERLFADACERGLNLDLRGLGWNRAGSSWADPPPGKGLTLLANQGRFIARHGIRAFVQKVANKVLPPEPVTFDFSARVREECVGEEYWRVLRECSVCLGVNRYRKSQWPGELPRRYSRLRDIEAPMVGAAYLTEYAPGIEELYDIGREIEVYRDATELVAKAAKLEGDEAQRRRLRTKGQRRALNDHTIERTMEKIALKLGIA